VAGTIEDWSMGTASEACKGALALWDARPCRATSVSAATRMRRTVTGSGTRARVAGADARSLRARAHACAASSAEGVPRLERCALPAAPKASVRFVSMRKTSRAQARKRVSPCTGMCSKPPVDGASAASLEASDLPAIPRREKPALRLEGNDETRPWDP